MVGKIEKHINDGIAREGALLFVLIDPCDYESPEKAVSTARQACEAGADVILIGGSTGAQGRLLDEVTRRVKESVNVPIILFPGNIATLTEWADAVYFMSLLNSRNPYWISHAQALAAPVIKRMKIEPLPVGYIVVEPGGTVGWVGDANAIPRHKPRVAAALALAGQYMGFRFIVTDVGSASPLGPVPCEIVREVKKAIGVPYIVAGGIKTTSQAREIIKCGADAIHLGTVAQEARNVRRAIGEFVKAIKEEGRKKR
ncbi:MAG: geranylgeranylglyceryl/heptaprenylglyceryl phosphate synthase [Candidatus Micrarchaeota archaeon]